MSSFKQNLQKFLVYFFTGTSVLIVILGISRIKKGDSIAVAPTPEQNTGTTGDMSGLAVRGSTETTFKGKTYQTPWGNLAATIQVKDGKVVAVEIPTLPDSPPSHEAKAYLIEQAIRSGGANIQGVTGATITSLAFRASLESALSQAANATSALATNNVPTVDSSTSSPLPIPGVPQTSPTTIPTPTLTSTKAKTGISGTFTGNAYGTPWGNAVASITISNGKITGVKMPVVPNSPPSVYAEPYLVQQALAAGSANIQGVSGATYASLAFKQSLESAIAKANATATTQGQAVITTQSSSATTQTTPAPSVPRSYRDDDDEGEDNDDEWEDEEDEWDD